MVSSNNSNFNISPDLRNILKSGSMSSGMGSLLGAGILGFGNKSNNPANNAMSYLDRIPETLRPYLMPYINAGQNSLGNLKNHYSNLSGLFPDIQKRMGDMSSFTGDLSSKFQNMTNDPTGMMNKIGSSYQSSPGFNFKKDQALRAAQNAAASGGYLGSPQHQQQSMELANNIANQDYDSYVGHGLDEYHTGLSGLKGQQGELNSQLKNLMSLFDRGLTGEEHLNDMGFKASSDLSTSLANLLGSKANLSYAGDANKNMMDQGQWGALAALLGSGGGSLLNSFFM